MLSRTLVMALILGLALTPLGIDRHGWPALSPALADDDGGDDGDVLAGAGLDVYEFEPKVPQALINMENVTLLPHLGTAALEVRTNMGMMAVDNLIAFAEGRTLPNAV